MVTVKITESNGSNPPGKLADAELHFVDGPGTSNLTPLAGCKLIGFAVWETRDGRRNVTFPARQYSVNGERRSFALLRPIADGSAQERLKQFILDVYDAHVEARDAEAPPAAPFA